MLEVLGAQLNVEDAKASCFEVARVPAADFLPYHYARSDNYLAMNTLR